MVLSEGEVQIFFINQKMPLELVGFEPGAAAFSTFIVITFLTFSEPILHTPIWPLLEDPYRKEL